jgi:hypothetical protein
MPGTATMEKKNNRQMSSQPNLGKIENKFAKNRNKKGSKSPSKMKTQKNDIHQLQVEIPVFESN